MFLVSDYTKGTHTHIYTHMGQIPRFPKALSSKIHERIIKMYKSQTRFISSGGVYSYESKRMKEGIGPLEGIA